MQYRLNRKTHQFGKVFVTVYGDAYCRFGFNSTLNYSINKTLKSGYEFECPRLSPHIFRHTFATRCIESGVDIKTLSEILGHSSVSFTLNTYVHPSFQEKCIQMEKLNNLTG